jgi:hypothetical protein
VDWSHPAPLWTPFGSAAPDPTVIFNAVYRRRFPLSSPSLSLIHKDLPELKKSWLLRLLVCVSEREAEERRNLLL